MLVLLVNVHLTGDKPVWQELVGPVLLAATAVIAAAIAARTANKRQAEQLSHDRELQAEQLAYDRDQRNRQHVHDAVDEAVHGVDSALRVARQYVHARIVQAEAAEIHAYGNAILGASIDLVSQNLRLGLRLGNDHEIVTRHRAFQFAYSQRHDLLMKLSNGAFQEQDHPDHVLVEGADIDTGNMVSEFFSACRDWLGGG